MEASIDEDNGNNWEIVDVNNLNSQGNNNNGNGNGNGNNSTDNLVMDSPNDRKRSVLLIFISNFELFLNYSIFLLLGFKAIRQTTAVAARGDEMIDRDRAQETDTIDEAVAVAAAVAVVDHDLDLDRLDDLTAMDREIGPATDERT